MKKILALVLALAMILAVTVASAASITVNNTGDHKPETDGTDNTEYKWYRVFDASFVNGTDASEGVRYYTTSSTVKTALEAITVNGHKFTLTAVPGTNPAEWNITSDFVQADAVELSEKIEAAKDKWVAGNGTFKAGEKQTVDPGYYLVTSTLGSKVILDTLGAENINEKNEYITDGKTVAKTNYNVGELVDYTITVNIPATTDFALPIIVHDTMDADLALKKNTVAIKNGTTDFTTFSVSDPVADTSRTGFNKFDITLDVTALTGATTLTITYKAEVLSTAAADEGFINEEFTEYSDYTTKPKDVTVKTYDFNVAKIFTGKTTDNTLYAKFEIQENGEAINLIQGDDATHLVRPDSDDEATPFTEFSVYQNAPVNIRGLAAGSYVLHETYTAPGFNALTEDITVMIDAEGNVSVNSDAGSDIALTDGTVTVTNNAGTELPSTGGIGTTIFYVLGGILVIGAAVILVARRKAHE